MKTLKITGTGVIRGITYGAIVFGLESLAGSFGKHPDIPVLIAIPAAFAFFAGYVQGRLA